MSAPKVVAGIQARMGSSRLPGKVLADLAGKPLIQRLYERVARAERVDEAWVLTSTDAEDDALVDFLRRADIPCRRGPLEDVLARFLALAREREAGTLVRITGDCPLVSPSFIDAQVEAAHATEADFVVLPGDGAPGTLAGQSLMSARALGDAARSSDPRDREHVGTFFFLQHRGAYRSVRLEVDPRLLRDDVRLCVDEEPDLELVRAIFAHFAPIHDSQVPLLEALEWLDANPELRRSNLKVPESDANREARALYRDQPARIIALHPRRSA